MPLLGDLHPGPQTIVIFLTEHHPHCRGGPTSWLSTNRDLISLGGWNDVLYLSILGHAADIDTFVTITLGNEVKEVESAL